MQPALGDRTLTLDELRSYMMERADDIEFYLDNGHVSINHAEIMGIRRNLYRNLIEIIDQGYIHNPPATDVTPDAGKPSFWLRVKRWGHSF